MKINSGKGWEAMKQHPSQHHLHAANAVPNASARALGGGPDTARGPQPRLSEARLNAAQPPPPSPKPGVGPKRELRQGASGVPPQKRQSGAAGGLTDVVTPAASTQAQFPNSTTNLGHNRMSQANPGMNQQTTALQNSRQPTPDQQPTIIQKIMKVLCCGR